MKRFLIGIVPSFTDMGAAIYDVNLKTLKTKSGEYLEVLKWISKNAALSVSGILIENHNLTRINFAEWETMRDVIDDHIKYERWLKRRHIRNIPEKVTMIDVQSDFIKKMSKAQKFGADREAANTLMKLLTNKGYDFVEISPERRSDMTKVLLHKHDIHDFDISNFDFPKGLTSSQFKFYYSLNANTQAKCDAATLVVGKDIRWFNLLDRHNEPSSYPSESNSNYFLVKRQ